MVEDLRAAFKEMLEENDWMDDATRSYAKLKADQMIALIAYPDFILNDTALDEYYDKVSPSLLP